MTETDLDLIHRLSTGLLKNVAIHEMALAAATEAGVLANSLTLYAKDSLALFNLSGGNIEKMKELAKSKDRKPGSSFPFEEESDRVHQEMIAQARMLQKLIGLEENLLEASPAIFLAKLKHLAQAGLVVAKEG